MTMTDLVKTGKPSAEQLDRAFEMIRDSFDAFVDRVRGMPYTKDVMQEWFDEVKHTLQRRTGACVHTDYNPVDFILTITMAKLDKWGNETFIEYTVNLRGW